MTLSPGAFSSAMMSHRPSAKPGAVRFDGNDTYLFTNSLTAVNSPLFSQFFWFQDWTQDGSSFPTYWVVDPNNSYSTYQECRIRNDLTIDPDGTFATNDDNFELSWDMTVTLTPGPDWHWLLMSGDMNHAAHLKKFQVLYDGTDVTEVYRDNDGAFSPEFNGLPFFFGSDGFGSNLSGNFSQYWLNIGTSLLDGSGHIPLVTQKKFVNNGKPQFPSGWPGTPTILFDGDDSTFGDNQGTGGPFTLNSGPLITVTGPGG